MRNRDRYISGRNEYDLMMTIAENAGHNECPIKVVTGSYPKQYGLCIKWGLVDRKCCSGCVEKWLNEGTISRTITGGNTCVSCGETIPEGAQVCPICAKKK